MSRKTVWAVCGILLMTGFSLAADGGTERNGPWLGETRPGKAPVLFAPGFVSTGLYERDLAVTPDGKELYFGIMGADFAVIAVCRLVDGKWTGPEIAPFSADPAYLNLEPCISPDGKKFFFLSTRPSRPDLKPAAGWAYQDIWVMDRLENGWSEPKNLGAPVNTDKPEYFPSVARNGTLYFIREEGGEGQEGKQAVYRSRLKDGQYTEPERLPAQVNGAGHVFNACISPDESFLIFCCAKLPDKKGRVDYYVSFRKSDDTWSDPVNLGQPVNMPGDAANSPALSPDGQYFFFGSSRKTAPEGKGNRTYQSLQHERNRPGNGNSDIYWMEAAFIEALRPQGNAQGEK